MRKQSAKTTKIIKYLEDNPSAKAAAVAEKFDIHVSRVYQLRKKVLDAFVKEFIDEDTVYELPEGTMYELPEDPTSMPTNVDGVLDSRAADYGKFADGARLMQGLKRLISEHANAQGKTFADDQWEALEMIVHKIGRIVNGNPDKVDHWTDIAGYAKLVADRLEGRAR